MAATPGTAARTDRIGVCRRTGRYLVGWDHCQQSIEDILTTRVNTRVMMLPYGSDLPPLLDRPGNRETIALCYVAIYTALSTWEPGFRLSQMRLVKGSPDGNFIFWLSGLYFPRGHLGDYSFYEAKSFEVPVKVASVGGGS